MPKGSLRDVPSFKRTLPTFPLDEPPICGKWNGIVQTRCYSRTVRKVTKKGNENGNEGRPYYICPNHYGWRWKTWDDYGGLNHGNPSCYCGLPSRQTRKSKHTKPDGSYNPFCGRFFWSCSIGECSYYYSEDDLDGPEEEKLAGR